MKPSIEEQIAAVRQHLLGLDVRGRMGVSNQIQIAAFKAILATLSQHKRAMAALRSIRLRAGSDGSRTFDDVIRDIGWIDDECRAALDTAETEKGR